MKQFDAGAVADPSAFTVPPARSHLLPWLTRIQIRPDYYVRRQFWAVQVLVVILAVLHTVMETQGWVHDAGALYFIPEALFLIPVGYAALNFGLHGSVATALWCTALALPNLIWVHHGLEAGGAALQLVILNIVGFFVGQRVDHEVAARRQADDARLALVASEARYRGLFENSANGILVYDLSGRIHAANSLVARLFGRSPEAMHGLLLSELVGEKAADRLLQCSEEPGSPDQRIITVCRPNGAEAFLEAACTRFSGSNGEPMIQTALHDITIQRRRQQDLRSYAGRILHAQEEERRRIAQELHDDTLQALVILCRHLDSIQEAATASGGEVHARVRVARETAESLMAGLRSYTRRLRPPALDDLGVVICLQRLLAQASARSGIRTDMKVTGWERRLTGERELALYRIAQESVHNVERHARAVHLTVTLQFGADFVELRVADDGRGFVLAPSRLGVEGRDCLGLLGMQERSALVGGSLQIESAPGRGTVVVTRIPV